MAKKRGQGEGGIYKRADGTWEAKLTIGRTLEGKQKRKSFYGKTRREVDEKLTAAKAELNKGTYVEASKMTLGEWCDIWLREYKKQTLSPNTYLGYHSRINNHIKPKIGDIKLKDLRIDTIQKFVNELSEQGLSSNTVKRYFSVLSGVIKQAVINELILKDVSKYVRLPKVDKQEIDVLTIEEQEKFIEVAKTVRYGEIFIIMLATGLRNGEVLALTWEDVDFSEGILRINKTYTNVKDPDDRDSKYHHEYGSPKTPSSNRKVPLLPNVVELLEDLKGKLISKRIIMGNSFNERDLIFYNKRGQGACQRWVRRVFKDILQKANLKNLHPHCLRHTFATRCLENGIELKVVQELLGHSEIAMTANTYTHVLPDKKKDSIMKLKDTIKL